MYRLRCISVFIYYNDKCVSVSNKRAIRLIYSENNNDYCCFNRIKRNISKKSIFKFLS